MIPAVAGAAVSAVAGVKAGRVRRGWNRLREWNGRRHRLREWNGQRRRRHPGIRAEAGAAIAVEAGAAIAAEAGAAIAAEAGARVAAAAVEFVKTSLDGA